MQEYLLSDEIFQDGRFSRTLAADDRDLRQIDGHVNPQLGERILHPIDDRDERLHPDISRRHVDARVLLVPSDGFPHVTRVQASDVSAGSGRDQ